MCVLGSDEEGEAAAAAEGNCRLSAQQGVVGDSELQEMHTICVCQQQWECVAGPPTCAASLSWLLHSPLLLLCVAAVGVSGVCVCVFRYKELAGQHQEVLQHMQYKIQSITGVAS